MDDEEGLQPARTTHEIENFQRLETGIIASIPLVFGIIIEIIGITFISLWPEEQSKCDSYFIMIYLHCGFWFIIMIVDYVLKTKHHHLRICGYLDFYQSTYQHIRVPLFISSLWNTVLLLIAAILHHTHKNDYETYCRSSEWLTPINYIFLFTTLELMIIVPTYINYLKRVRRFNRTQPLPDVMREEWLTSYAQNSYAGCTEIGYEDNNSHVLELLEKQADLIRYLRDHNVKLSSHMMTLVSQQHLNST